MSEQEYDKEQLRILRNAFKAFDHDERGYIEHSDVQNILEILGQKLDDKATKALIKEVDPKTTGKLDFSQFCRLAARFIEVEEDANALASELKEAFRVYDKEGKGYLTVQTLRGILHELDDKLSNNDLDMIIEEIDADGSGTVDFDEFMQVMTGNDFLDLNWQRRFVFETHPIHSNQSFHRMRLHRRIEWYFDRLLHQMWQPFEWSRHARITSSHVKSSSKRIESSPSPTNVAPLPSKPLNDDIRKRYCYRSVYRPRFPKWVPILTLYREIVQNPFRSRGRYMITHY